MPEGYNDVFWLSPETQAAVAALREELEGADPTETYLFGRSPQGRVTAMPKVHDGDDLSVLVYDPKTGWEWSWAANPDSGLLSWWRRARRFAANRGLKLPLLPTPEAAKAHEEDTSAWWFVREMQ